MAGRLGQLVSRYGLPKAGGGGLADYSEVEEDDPAQMAGVAQKEFGALKGAGLQAEAPPQEPPDVPDLGKFQQARDRTQLTNLVHGFTGTRTMTPYGAKLGQKSGETIDSPAWDAASSAAADPWVMEQARVKNANQLHAFVNQYAMLKSGVSDKNKQQAIDMAREQAIMRGTQGVLKSQFKLQQDQIDAQNRRSDAQIGLQNDRMDQADERLAQGEEHLKLARERERRSAIPSPVDAERYGAAASAITAAENADKLLQDKSTTDPFQGAVFDVHPETKMLTINGGRISSSPKAKQLSQQLSILHHYLLMQDPRQGTRFGASLLQPAFRILGADPSQARGVVRQLLTGPLSVKQALETKYDQYNWGNELAIYNGTHPLPPESEINAPGDKSAIQQELEKRGIKLP